MYDCQNKCDFFALTGWVPFSRVEQEFAQIHAVLEKKRQEAEAAKLLPFYKRVEPFTKRGFIAPFVLVSATFMIGHFTGKTPLQTYAVQVCVFNVFSHINFHRFPSIFVQNS